MGAAAGVSAERMRAALPPAASAAAVLQSRLPASGAGVVAVESAGEIPGHGGGQTAAERAKPALPGARSPTETSRASGPCGGREGNPSRFFSDLPATGQAATKDLCGSGEVRGNGSVRTRAGGRWSGSGSGSGAGRRPARAESNRLRRRVPGPAASVGRGEIIPTY